MSCHLLPTLFVIASLCGAGGCAKQSADARSPTTRTYYIAADEVVWDYALSGMNRITGQPFTDEAAFWVVRGPNRLGRIHKKIIFHEYTDDTFTKLQSRPPEWEHLGMLGPLLRAEVGDTIHVVFKNNGRHPFSLHPTASRGNLLANQQDEPKE